MTIWTVPLSLALLAAAGDGADRAYILHERSPVGAQTHNRAHMTVRGRIQAGKEEMDLVGQALIEFDERTLKMREDGLPTRVARYYTDARAKFVVGTNEDPRQLRRDVRLLVGERRAARLALWSLTGPLTGVERELIEESLDVGYLAAVLPGEEVTVGQSWDANPAAMSALCDFDHLIDCQVKGKLSQIDKDRAVIELAGLVHGVADGAAVKSKIDAQLVYDLALGMIVEAQWKQTDGRAPGPVSPAGAYDVLIKVTRSPTDAKALSDEVARSADVDPQSRSLLLTFEHPDKKYRFVHDRNWHVTTMTSDAIIMRRVDDGELTSQLNVTLLKDRRPGTMMDSQELREMIQTSTGGTIEELTSVDSIPAPRGINVRLVAARGVVDELPLIYRHFLVTSEQGNQLIFTFVMEPATEEKVGTTDLGLVTSVEFPGAATAGKDAAPTK